MSGHNPARFRSFEIKIPVGGKRVVVGEEGGVVPHEWGTTNIRIRNTSNNTLYFGGDDVTDGNGYPLKADETILLERVNPFSVLYVCQSDKVQTQGTIRVLWRDT